MKRFTLVAFLLVAGIVSLFGQAKPGGIARELAMGGSNAGTMLVLNPFIMDDPSLMLVNPAYQASYRDYAWANVAGGALTGLSSGGGPIGDDGYGHQFAGVAFGLNDQWSVGAILSYDPSAANLNNTLIAGGGLFPAFTQAPRTAQSIPAIANVWEASAAYRASSIDFGVGFMYGWSNSDNNFNTSTPTSGTREASSSMWGVRGGVNANLGGGSSLDASVAYRNDKATDNRTSSPVVAANSGNYSSSASEFQANLRFKLNVSSKFNFVPYGTLVSISAEPKEDVPPSTVSGTQISEKATVLAYALGAGGEYRTSSFYFAGGVSWQSLRLKGEYNAPLPTGSITNTITYTAIPVLNLGGEWWFTDWLAGRAGYFRSIGKINTKSESTGGTSESNFSAPNSFVSIGGINPGNYDGMVTMGLGFKFGGACIDATVSEEALRRGLGLIGASDNINSFGYLTASFAFGD
ncbi:MAG TPA: hypothetical protein VI215_12600 [Bacteroidota bacterium]|jgi:hypothetical protein